MTPPNPDPQAVWARPGTGPYLVRMLLGALGCGVFTAVVATAVFSGSVPEGFSRVFGTVIAAGCCVITVGCLLVVAIMPWYGSRLPAVAIDQYGVWWSGHGRHAVLPWQDIAAVGVSYKRPPRMARGMRLPQDHAFEVFPRDPARVEGDETLRRWLREEEPHRSGLPPVRMRFMLPLVQQGGELYAAVARYAPGLWIGEFRRLWSRVPGT